MKKVFAVAIFAICIFSIIAGKIHWDTKIKATSNPNQVIDNNNDETGTPTDHNSDDSGVSGDFTDLLTNFPENIATTIETKLESGDQLEMIAMGSAATAEGDGTWTNLLQQQLDEAYGNGVFQLNAQSFGNDLSIDVTQEQKHIEVANLEPDILLLEPFLLNDNGVVAVDNSLESVGIIINAVESASEDVVIILQPPNPIHNAVYYPGQVDALQAYAQEHDIIYLDHWTNWPDQTSDDILDYIDEEDSTPNEKGHEIWAEYIANYFTGEAMH